MTIKLIALITIIVILICPNQAQLSKSFNQDPFKIFTQFQHKFSIDILSSFNLKSDVTVVITSCNQINMLEVSLNSFFHFNTYTLRQIIIIDYCGAKQKDLWKLLPNQAQQFKSIYFTVLRLPQNQSKFEAISFAYSHIKTKYVYHFNHQWVHIGTYGFIQRFKDALQDVQKKQIKISQISQTYPHTNVSLMSSTLFRTQKNTKYFMLSPFTKQYTNVFNFNPHFLNFDIIYKQFMKNSYKDTIMRLYKCNQFKKNQKSNFIENIDKCIQFYLSQYMEMNEYKQLYVDLGSSMYININKLFISNVKTMNLEIQLNLNNKQKKRVKKQFKANSQAKIHEKNHNSQFKQFQNQQLSKQTNNFIVKLLQILIISVTLFIFFKIIQTIALCCKKSGPQVSIPKTINSNKLVGNIEQ